jgi:hypothetical protein
VAKVVEATGGEIDLPARRLRLQRDELAGVDAALDAQRHRAEIDTPIIEGEQLALPEPGQGVSRTRFP